MREPSRDIVHLTLVIVLLWGCFWIASLGAVSITSLLLGILITVIGGLIVGVPGSVSPGHRDFAPGLSPVDPGLFTGTHREGLDVPRRGVMLDGGGAWERLPFSREGTGRESGFGEDPTPAGGNGRDRLPGSRLRRFEATWEQALKEFDPGPGDVLISSVSTTRMAKEFLSGFGGPLEGLSPLRVTGNMPGDVLILREVVETRAAPDRTVYRRTIQALMRKDGMCEYRALGKEAGTSRFPYQSVSNSS
jgi:hypothetical protein